MPIIFLISILGQQSFGGIFDFDAKKERSDEISFLEEDPEIWKDSKRAQELGREKKILDKIVLTRPAVEAGERLGFLPGDMRDKVDPYLRPLYDSLYDLLDFEKIQKKIEIGDIEIAPLAFMRGRTLDKAFVILDEGQNTTIQQMKMFLTRMGKSAKFIITGDETQVDLPKNKKSGLTHAKMKLNKIKEISFVHLDSKDIIRHNIVTKIINEYKKDD